MSRPDVLSIAIASHVQEATPGLRIDSLSENAIFVFAFRVTRTVLLELRKVGLSYSWTEGAP